MLDPIVLFGEAQKGDFQKGYYCKDIVQLSDYLGEPPSNDSKGLSFAIQALLFKRSVIYFRVHEEGFSTADYFLGINLLKKNPPSKKIVAICMPGVGNVEIIEATTPLCLCHKSFLILTESDLYDYLTCSKLI